MSTSPWSIIRHTAEIFDPHLFLVDKEPLGLRGEVERTLSILRRRGTRCVLGLRDVMDDPRMLVDEWERKGVFPALQDLYDDIWVYGLPEIFDPLREVPGMRRFADKLAFTGYIRRAVPEHGHVPTGYALPPEPFVLVTTGGGGDGEDLIDWVLRAYEHDPGIPYPALILFGPFMNLDDRMRFQARVNRLEKVRATTFEAQVETLFERAAGVVAMGGYNTFCEILSFGKPSLIMPRTVPRLEQALRAERASGLGLVRCIADDGVRDAARMAEALRDLPHWPKPNPSALDRMFTGLESIASLAAPWLDEHHVVPRRVGAAG